MYTVNILLTRGLDALRSRLPPGWSADLDEGPGLRIAAPDGRVGELRVVVHKRLDPRRAEQLAATTHPADRPALALAPWMSPDTRARLAGAGIHTLDLTGGVHLALSEPGLYLEAPGAARDPWPDPARVTLRGAKAASVVGALCRVPLPAGVRQLAGEAGTTPGYVSKLLAMLDRRAVLSRPERGGVDRIDLRRLLEAWAEDAPLHERAEVAGYGEPRGLSAFLTRLGGVEQRYAITGRLGAWLRTPAALPRIAEIYVEDPAAIAAATGLRPAPVGGNVLLLAPRDAGVFDHTGVGDGLVLASLPRIAADLLSEPDRAPAEALLDWMTEHPGDWRG